MCRGIHRGAIVIAVALFGAIGTFAAEPISGAPALTQADFDAFIRFLPEFQEMRTLPATPENMARFRRFAGENGLDLDRFLLCGIKIGIGLTMQSGLPAAKVLTSDIPESLKLSEEERLLLLDNFPDLAKAAAEHAGPGRAMLRDDEAVIARVQDAIALSPPFEAARELADLLPRISESSQGVWAEILPAMILLTTRDFSSAASRLGEILDRHPPEALGHTLHAFLLRVRSDAFLGNRAYPEALAGYQQVLERYGQDDLPAVGLQRAIAMVNLGLVHSFAGEREKAEAAFSGAVKEFAELGDGPPLLRLQKAAAYNNLAALLSLRNNHAGALIAIDLCLSQVRDSELPALVEMAARALVAKGVLLLQAGDVAGARAIFAEAAAEYAHGPAAVAMHAFNAMNNNLAIARQLGEKDTADRLADELLAAFGQRTEPEFLERALSLRLGRAASLAQEGNHLAAVKEIRIAVENPAVAGQPAFREKVAGARWMLGNLLLEAGDPQASAAAMEQLIADFGGDEDTKTREVLSQAYGSLAFARKSAGDYAGAIDAYRELVTRFGDDQDMRVKKNVVTSMRFLAEELLAEDRADEAIAVYQDIVTRFGDLNSVLVSVDVMHARNALKDTSEAGKIAKVIQFAQRRDRETQGEHYLARLENLLERYGGREEPEIDSAIAEVMFSKAIALFNAGRNEEGDRLVSDMAERYGSRSDPKMRRMAIKALQLNAWRKHRDGDREAAMAIYRTIVERYGEDKEDMLLRVEAGEARDALKKLEQERIR